MTRLPRPCTAVVGASSAIEERSPSVGRPPCGPSHWRYNCEVRSTSPSVSTCLGSCAFRGAQELRKILPTRVHVNDSRNDRRARRNLSGCRRPGLVSVQSANQCLGYALKRPHHPDHVSNCYLLLSENMLTSPGVRPLRCGCYWRRHASSPSTPSSASATSSNHDYLHTYNQLDQQHYNQI